MVIGDRLSSTYFKENKRLFHNFGNVLVRGLINKLFKRVVHLYNSFIIPRKRISVFDTINNYS